MPRNSIAHKLIQVMVGQYQNACLASKNLAAETAGVTWGKTGQGKTGQSNLVLFLDLKTMLPLYLD